MLKQYLRGAYLAVCYVIGLPILFVMLLGLMFVTIIKDIIDGYGFEFDDITNMMSGMIDGLKIGHERNVQFVKYGSDYDKWFSQEQES